MCCCEIALRPGLYPSMTQSTPITSRFSPFHPHGQNSLPPANSPTFSKPMSTFSSSTYGANPPLTRQSQSMTNPRNHGTMTIVRTLAEGVERRRMTVSHVVLAVGYAGGQPKMPPPLPGQLNWSGKVVHSSGHSSGAESRGKKALVVGSATSAHDVSHSTYHTDRRSAST